MKKILLLLLFFITKNVTFAQPKTADCHQEGGVFISEIGNYGHGEYIELTVYGSTANPTAPVNLEGWIIDDNNKPEPYVGNEKGHIRFGEEFSAVAPGTLIVIASKKDKPGEVAIFPDYLYEPGRIITFGKGLIGVDNCPTYDTKGSKQYQDNGYDCESSSAFTDFKDYAALDNVHDAIQIRKPDGELVHALYWTADYEEAGNLKAVDITAFLQKTNIKGNINLSHVKFMGGSNWFDVNNFEIFPVIGKSKPIGNPGSYNSSSHAKMQQQMQQGVYSNQLKAEVAIVQQPTSSNYDGIIEVNVSGGIPNFYILIEEDGGNHYYLQEEFTKLGVHRLNNVPTGKMKIIISDDNCFINFDLELIAANPVCGGECQIIGVEPDKYCKYEWKASKDIKNTTQSKVNVCPTETTTYTLRVIDNDGNVKNINFTVAVKEAEVSQKIALICSGQSKTLRVKGSNPTWSTGEKNNEIVVNSIGLYGVTVTDEKGCNVKNSIEVLSGNNPDNIKKYFRALGFHEGEADIRNQPPALTSDETGAKPISGSSCNVTDLSKNTALFLEEEIKLKSEFERLCKEKLSYTEQFSITENQTVCENYAAWEQVEGYFLSDKKTYWTHKFLNSSQKCFFTKANYKGDFFLSDNMVNFEGNEKNITNYDNFFLYSDRGEPLNIINTGKKEYIPNYGNVEITTIRPFSSLQYRVPSGVYFINNTCEYKFNYLSSYKLVYPHKSFKDSPDMMFYINKEFSNAFKKVHEDVSIINKIEPNTERGGLCYIGDGKKMIAEECIPCKNSSTPLGMKPSDVLSEYNYPNFIKSKADYFIATWHAHPIRVYLSEKYLPTNNKGSVGVYDFSPECGTPSGTYSSSFTSGCSQYGCDVGVIKNQTYGALQPFLTTGFSNCIEPKEHIKFHKLASGIGIIAGNNGITIYRHTHEYLYNFTESTFSTECNIAVGGKYYTGKSGYKKFQRGDRFYIINYNLNAIVKSFRLDP
jgi:hypothetical protein